MWLLSFALYFEVLLCWVLIHLQLLYLFGLILWSLYSVLLCLCNSLYFKVYFVRYEYCCSSFLLISICMEHLFPPPHLQFVCVPASEMGLFEIICIWVLFLYSFSYQYICSCCHFNCFGFVFVGPFASLPLLFSSLVIWWLSIVSYLNCFFYLVFLYIVDFWFAITLRF